MINDKLIKKLGFWDIVLTQWAVFFFTLFLITIWSGFRNLVLSIDWYWFLIVGIILAIPVWKKMFS